MYLTDRIRVGDGKDALAMWRTTIFRQWPNRTQWDHRFELLLAYNSVYRTWELACGTWTLVFNSRVLLKIYNNAYAFATVLSRSSILHFATEVACAAESARNLTPFFQTISETICFSIWIAEVRWIHGLTAEQAKRRTRKGRFIWCVAEGSHTSRLRWAPNTTGL